MSSHLESDVTYSSKLLLQVRFPQFVYLYRITSLFPGTVWSDEYSSDEFIYILKLKEKEKCVSKITVPKVGHYFGL